MARIIFLRIYWILLLLIIFIQIFHIAFSIFLPGMVETTLKLSWLVLGLILFFWKKSALNWTFVLHPLVISLAILAIAIRGFGAALFLVVLGQFFIASSPNFKDKNISIRPGNNFISPTQNMDVFKRHYFFDQKIGSIKMENHHDLIRFRAKDLRDSLVLSFDFYNRFDKINSDTTFIIQYKKQLYANP